jgi:hypothetical protein
MVRRPRPCGPLPFLISYEGPNKIPHLQSIGQGRAGQVRSVDRVQENQGRAQLFLLLGQALPSHSTAQQFIQAEQQVGQVRSGLAHRNGGVHGEALPNE